jgi:ribose transport system ATP-binding protein
LLEVEGVEKTYPGVVALAGVDLTVEAGEVHALLGENGAGKSTLMKIIAGAQIPDAGRIQLDGLELYVGSPQEARKHGIAIVYQDLSLVPSLSIGENILLGQWPVAPLKTVDWPTLWERAAAYLERIGYDADPRRRVQGLGMAERQLVEIAKALAGSDTRVLLLDEPTSALSEREGDRLFQIIEDLRAKQVAVVYVSHRLREVLEIADRITVLRDGRRIDTIPASEADEDRLAALMVGREVESVRPDRDGIGRDREVVLRAQGLSRPPRLTSGDLTLRSGEIVTVFGLMGAGRTRLARTLFGLEPAVAGTLELFGRKVDVRTPADAIAHHVGYVGEDRSAGLVPRLSVAANITLAALTQKKNILLDFGEERELARRFVHELDIRIPAVGSRVETLSGGNQQKVLLARWLCSDVRILILDDPTRGVDVGAKEEVFRLVRRLASDGVAILYLTSEIREARSLGDRLLIMADGRVVAEVKPDAPEERIVAAAGGADGRSRH